MSKTGDFQPVDSSKIWERLAEISSKATGKIHGKKIFKIDKRSQTGFIEQGKGTGLQKLGQRIRAFFGGGDASLYNVLKKMDENKILDSSISEFKKKSEGSAAANKIEKYIDSHKRVLSNDKKKFLQEVIEKLNKNSAGKTSRNEVSTQRENSDSATQTNFQDQIDQLKKRLTDEFQNSAQENPFLSGSPTNSIAEQINQDIERERQTINPQSPRPLANCNSNSGKEVCNQIRVLTTLPGNLNLTTNDVFKSSNQEVAKAWIDRLVADKKYSPEEIKKALEYGANISSKNMNYNGAIALEFRKGLDRVENREFDPQKQQESLKAQKQKPTEHEFEALLKRINNLKEDASCAHKVPQSIQLAKQMVQAIDPPDLFTVINHVCSRLQTDKKEVLEILNIALDKLEKEKMEEYVKGNMFQISSFQNPKTGDTSIIEAIIHKMEKEEISLGLPNESGGMLLLYCIQKGNDNKNDDTIVSKLIDKMKPEEFLQNNSKGYTALSMMLDAENYAKWMIHKSHLIEKLIKKMPLQGLIDMAQKVAQFQQKKYGAQELHIKLIKLISERLNEPIQANTSDEFERIKKIESHQLLVSTQEKPDELQWAVESLGLSKELSRIQGFEGIVQYIIKTVSNEDLSTYSNSGIGNVLHLAAFSGSKKILESLYEKLGEKSFKELVNQPGPQGKESVLHCCLRSPAKSANKMECMRYLIEKMDSKALAMPGIDGKLALTVLMEVEGVHTDLNDVKLIGERMEKNDIQSNRSRDI